MEAYAPLRLIRQNDRFAAYEGHYEGRKVFIKQTVDHALRPRLLSEVAGLRVMAELDAAQRWYRVPEVIACHDDFIVTTWADGAPLEPLVTSDQAERHITYLFGLYAFIDARTDGVQGVTRYNRPGERSGVDRFIERAEALSFEQYIDEALVRAAAEYLREALSFAETRFTNGDLQPANLLLDGDNVWLVDCETASWLWPRHYNAVNFVFNYAVRYPQLASKLYGSLDAYRADIGVDGKDHDTAFNLTAALRCLGMVIEQLSAADRARTIDPGVKTYVETAMRRMLGGAAFYPTGHGAG